MDELTDDQRYAAISARDGRFDGVFFTCVRTTGIFCRPSCPARTPGRGSVEFVPSAAAAVERGYRACKRCGPLAPPGADAADPSGSLARRALLLIGDGVLDAGPDGPAHVADLAARLHVSERTLHRALVERTGASAVAHARMARARRAHELLRSTSLPLAEVASAAGFGSERQLHDTVRRIFGRSPSTIRGGSGSRSIREARPAPPATSTTTSAVRADAPPTIAAVRVDLAVRRPFDADGLLRWTAARAVPGTERVEGMRWARAVRLPRGPAVLEADLGADGPIPLEARLADLRDLPAAIALVRRLLDLDADPVGIDQGLTAALPALGPLVAARPGVRLPGTTSVGEALLWAIVGQQVTVVQTREQITRAADLLEREDPAGMLLPEELREDPSRPGALHRLPVDPRRAAERAEDWFRGPAARRRALREALSAPVGAGPSVSPEELRERLLALRGVGPWTADYVLLRAARAIDVVLPRDAALLSAARDLGLAADHDELATALAAASPWRSYAARHLWHHASAPRKDLS
ncbi:Ada metal-binding domain-containing protein [Brachybacterium sp. DNPG3]